MSQIKSVIANGAALNNAIRDEKIEDSSKLIKEGLDVHGEDAHGRMPLPRPLHIAAETKNVTILKPPFATGAKSEDKLALQKATQSNSVNVLKPVISANANSDSKKVHGWTPLHAAACQNDCNAAKLLISTGANLDSKNVSGWTPLHTAAYKNNSDVAELLISAGAHVNSKNNNNEIPLHFAAQLYSSNTTRILISAGSHINSKDNANITPLHLAVESRNPSTVKLMINAGAHINSKNCHLNTPLHLAAQSKASSIAEILINAGADVSSKNYQDETPLHLAAQSGDWSIVKLLINAGADVSSKNHVDKTPLDLAEKFRTALAVIVQHIALLKALDLPLDQSLLNSISSDKDYNYYFLQCDQELQNAKSTKIQNSWVSFFHLLVQGESKLLKYAGNKDLIKSFKKNVKQFPIYGSTMQNNMTKAVNGRALFDIAIITLSHYMPIFNPYHLVIWNILESLNAEDWKNLCENKHYCEI